MIRALLNRLTGKQHHWRVQFIYRSPSRVDLASMTMTISMDARSGIKNHRQVKVAAGPLILRNVRRSLLCNGSILMEPKVYLGWW